MKHFASLLLKTLVVCALTVPVLAGEGKCSADAQKCITSIAEHAKNKGWLGVELDESKYEHALVITKVVPESPAAKANLKVGETLASLNGVSCTDQEAMKTVYAEAVKPGKTVTYGVTGKNGYERQVKVTLGHMPEEIVAKWLGRHMLKQHSEVANVN